MKQVHGVDDQGYVGRILSGRIGELLLGYDGVLRQDVGPGLGSGIGEVAVDAANAGLPDLGNLFEQTIRDLCGRIVGVDQNGETGRADFRRHDFPQTMNTPRKTAIAPAGPQVDLYSFGGQRPSANPVQAGFASGITPPSATVSSAATARTV